MRGLQYRIVRFFGCERLVFPGNHIVWEFDAQGMATAFLKVLKELGKQKLSE